MADAKTLGGRLRAARKAAKLRQADTAQVLRCRVMTVSSYERDKTIPSAEWVRDAATLYRCPAGWLLTGEGKGPAEAA